MESRRLGRPLLFALAAIPLLIKGLGTERPGFLTLIWPGIGYSGLFDRRVSATILWIYLVVSAFGTVVYDNEPKIFYRRHASNVFGISAGAADRWKPNSVDFSTMVIVSSS
jgi:hypothetical protein